LIHGEKSNRILELGILTAMLLPIKHKNHEKVENSKKLPFNKHSQQAAYIIAHGQENNSPSRIL
jgi:hypothetical protein